MESFFQNLARAAMLAFLLAGMLDLGLSLSLREILAPLKSARLVAGALVANFVVVPLLALGLVRLGHLEAPFATGLLMLGLAPGAPFIPRLAQLAGGDRALAVALMVMLMVGSIVSLPLFLPLVVKGAEVNAGQIALSLFLLMLLPLVVGLVVRARLPSRPGWLQPMLRPVSDLGGLVFLVLTVVLNVRGVLGVFGTGAVLAGAVFVALSVLAGRVFSPGDPDTRTVLALSAGSRNFGAAILVGAQNFKDPKVNVMVVVSALVTLLILLPTARVLGRRAAARAPGSPAGARPANPSRPV